ncbi:MAG TPA: Lpg1974 family pore-forming outer membrane protein [Rhizomicrobium sp.]|jgi:hypothetical protein|nr:Lpg1974 family pore-forming outer membrane protein [Rhizomicrobium sp.]
MREIASTKHNIGRWQWLGTASAIAMLASISGAAADDPTSMMDGAHIWADIGGQLTDYASNPTTVFNDPTTPGNAIFIGPSGGWDGFGKFSFQPADSNWIFSLGLRYGRTNPKNFAGYGTLGTTGAGGEGAADIAHAHAQHRAVRHAAVHAAATGTADSPNYVYYSGFISHKESHAMIDFTVGQDVGLGMFGQEGSSILSLGVRFAQFQARTDIGYYTGTASSTSFSEHARISRSFNGVGPMIGWDASAPLGGDFNSQLSIDWGADASLLFGKQKTQLQATFSTGAAYPPVERHKSVTVPSIGGYLALSWHGFEGTKISLGYRADDYFGVLDGGFDTEHKIDRAFYGPFIKIGISD